MSEQNRFSSVNMKKIEIIADKQMIQNRNMSADKEFTKRGPPREAGGGEVLKGREMRGRENRRGWNQQ